MSRTTPQRSRFSVAAATLAQPDLRSADSVLAADVKALIVAGQRDAARDLFADLVTRQQRRASRIAYYYLRDLHDADEAVQDAFVKVFAHIASYREELPFEVWFTRILVNRCLDLRKSRSRRLRWVLPKPPAIETVAYEPAAPQPSPEDRLLTAERRRQIVAAVERLPGRQREVFTLCQLAEHSASEVGLTLGLSESTVRVHLFRAVRKLRELLERER